MKIKKTFLLSVILIIIAFAIAIYSYPLLPPKIASHWNAAGNAENYMSKSFGLFLFPVIMLGMFLLFLIIPLIDPLKKNFKKFRKHYDNFVLVMIIFFFYMYILTILWNFGHIFDMTLSIIPAIAILFIYIGFLLENSKRNWFVGIRTPWTMTNETVWNKTHKLGGSLFKLSGVISLLGLFFQRYIVWFILAPVIVSIIGLIIYSYIEWKKIKK